ncbi:hypothetical protein [Streptomyces hokutonensis]|uniref:hypothetical protein n=1 Tax=Streptomyces hokutonensis TaxID=1306990 RepID=UPI0033CE96A6
MRDHLLAANVALVVIEATSDYWKPFYYLLTGDPNVILPRPGPPLVRARAAGA